MNRAALNKLALKLGFPPGRWSKGGDGLRAEWESGSLISLRWEAAGEPTGSPFLTLDPRAKSGVLTWPKGSGGTPDTEYYERGKWERFDAWSDNDRPKPMGWAAWTTRAASCVMDRMRCLLCGERLSQAKGAAYTQDGLHHICVDCSGALKTWEPTPRAWPLGERRCKACQEDFDDDTPLFEGQNGKLCRQCRSSLIQPSRGLNPWL